jgi:hypothetical protein
MWVIDRKVKFPENGFLGRVQDGTFKPSQDNAVKPVAKPASMAQPMVPAKQHQVASQMPDDEEVAEDMLWDEGNIPEMEDGGLPDFVIRYYANQEPGDEADFTEF